jgi:hypothetical protein
MAPPSEEKPALLLWFISKITLINFPLTIVLNLIMVKYGMSEDLLTFVLAAFSASKILDWYDTLDGEVTDYIRKKYDI